ncbi:MAG: gliding motility-associated ABC transporter ATP-binding subunit GldA [Candidatus Cyclobacteriaceae bacterium M3_2C_046]
MSLQVKQLTKIYGKQKAVDNISFSVQEGEILGFLGPNGAGKSTTMKIATGFIPPTTGSVEIYQHNVQEDELAVKKLIGYLPEHNPLYLDMYVHEYLHFIGKLYQLQGAALKNRTGEMIRLCGLEVEQNKKIGTLSKGYRQRIGLAQALIHDPRVLILDEPTTGLDPNQIVEIRQLIKLISREKTVIFSTHIMQEVQALCDRVIIINQGKIVADNQVIELQKGIDKQAVLSLEFSQDVDMSPFEQLPTIHAIEHTGAGLYQLKIDKDQELRSEIFRIASEQDLPLLGLKKEENTMEMIFQQLTRKEASQGGEK